jgi:hypothetical protein
MNPRIATLVIASVMPIAPAHAGPCATEVAQFRNSLPQQSDGDQTAIGSAPQSLAAQLSHQPTPASIEQARRNAQASVARTLAEAEKLDAEGNQSACEDALARAKLLANP